MDTDANTLDTALAFLREQFGGRLDGPMRRTMADMRTIATAAGVHWARPQPSTRRGPPTNAITS